MDACVKNIFNMKKLKNLPVKWQNWRIKHILFILKEETSTILPRLMSRVMNFYRRSSLYSRCNELTLERFMRCICDGDIRALRKHPLVSKSILYRTWARVGDEYAKLSGDTGYESNFVLYKDMARESGKLELVKSCLRILHVRYSETCVSCLPGLGYTYKFDENDPVGYRRDLDLAGKKARMISVELAESRGRYNKILSKQGSQRSTKEDFSRVLAILSKYMGYRVDPRVITVEEYVMMQKQYEKKTKNMSRLSKDHSKSI